jgi:anti-sigma B factor antagonist
MGDSLPRVEFDVSRRRDGHIVLRLSGELDMSAKWLFQERLTDVIEANDDDGILVDLAGVSFIDSTALAVLIRAHQQLDAAGRKLLIARPSRPVVRVFEVAGLGAVFDYEPE